MSLWKNVQFSLRSMRKSPRIALTVLATLTLGIGANTAIFSVVNATLLKPLPFHNPGELVELNADLRGLGAHNVGFSVPELDDLRDRVSVRVSQQHGPQDHHVQSALEHLAVGLVLLGHSPLHSNSYGNFYKDALECFLVR